MKVAQTLFRSRTGFQACSSRCSRLAVASRQSLPSLPLLRSFPASGLQSSAGVATKPAAVANTEAAASAYKGEKKAWEIKMLYDGDCPLCMREVNMLKARDAGQDRIAFVDIAADSYDPANNAGITFEQAMGTIHGILPDGRTITNVEVFRRLYEVVGLGWVYAITRVEPVGRLAEAVYGVWAKYRMPITGRPDLSVILEQREKRLCKELPKDRA